MFHGKITQLQSGKRQSGRLARVAAMVAVVVAGAAWSAQASADITVIYSSDDRDRHHHRHNHRHHNDGVGLIGSLLMPGSVHFQNIRHSHFDRHHNRYSRHDRYDRHDRHRHPHAKHSRHRESAHGNRGRWQSNRHREIIYVDKDARHRGNYRDVERRSVIIRRRDR